MKSRLPVAMAFVLVAASRFSGFAQKPYAPSPVTRLIFLGTGTPNADPQHSGNSLAIVVNDTPYIVDFGPGLIRQAAALSPQYGGKIAGLEVANIKRAFLTHLHSDHTTGYPDLILTPWVLRRDAPWEVYGPEGITAMTEHVLEAYREDIRVRIYGLEPANNQGWRVISHEIKEGIVYKDGNVTVEAFRVEHGSWPDAYGFKFTTPDRVIAVSGDTKPCPNLVEKCRGVDILVHEVYSSEKLKERTPFWQKYHPQFHTSTLELAEIAKQVRPGLLVLYHQLYWGISDKELVKEITDHYQGKVVSARDLDVY
jgi:ribonuclease BN (tRNA processing enzyme)